MKEEEVKRSDGSKKRKGGRNEEGKKEEKGEKVRLRVGLGV